MLLLRRRWKAPALNYRLAKEGSFVIELPSSFSPELTIAAVLDADRQSDLIPFTKVRRVDDELLTRTDLSVLGAWGRKIGFDDPMQIVRMSPRVPGAVGVRVNKLGRVITGWVEVEALPSVDGSRLFWRQHIQVRGLPRWLNPLVAKTARAGYRRILQQLLRAP